MADPYEPCRKQYHREGAYCVHNRDPKQRYKATKRPVSPKQKGPVPNPVGQPIPNPSVSPGTTTTQEPFSGTITPAVSAGGDTGTSPAAAGGDMTGTSALTSELASVFGSGSSSTPQYNYGLQTQQNEAVAQTMLTQPQGG